MIVSLEGVEIPTNASASPMYPGVLVFGPGTRSILLFVSPSSETIGCHHTSAAGAERTPSSARATQAHRPAHRARRSGHDDHITAFQLDVLVELPAAAHAAVAEVEHTLRGAAAADDDDAVELRIGIAAARERERLQHVERRIHDEEPGLVDLADDVDDIALDLRHHHGRDRLGDVLLEARLHLGAD